MSERKVLNKYYPPDFDPTKLPKLKRGKDRQFVIRIMAPFSMRCTTCGEYIYKGRKFNSRMETVQNENYLGLRIYRFYIRCTKCISEITFKTDPKSSDYVMEKGATRNFESLRRLQEKIERESKEVEQEEAANPMKALETRTRDSKREMESIEKLEELRDLNTRAAAIDPEKLIEDHLRVGQRMVEDEIKRQEQEDEDMIKNIFGKSGTGGDGYLRRIMMTEAVTTMTLQRRIKVRRRRLATKEKLLIYYWTEMMLLAVQVHIQPLPHRCQWALHLIPVTKKLN